MRLAATAQLSERAITPASYSTSNGEDASVPGADSYATHTGYNVHNRDIPYSTASRTIDAELAVRV